MKIRAAGAYRYRWAIVLAAAACGLGAGCARKEVPAKPAPKARPAPPAAKVEAEAEPKVKVTATKVTLRWEDGGKPRLTAVATKGVINALKGTGELKRATATLYRNGKPAAVVDAPVVRADRASGTVWATGGVTVRSAVRNTVVHSSEIEWLANQHKIVATGGVTVDSEVGQLSAESLVADTELRTLELRAGQGGGRAKIRG